MQHLLSKWLRMLQDEAGAVTTSRPPTPTSAKVAPTGLPWQQLVDYPPPERWEDWQEYDPTAWPRKVTRRYTLVPTVCFNCEAACGLLAYVDKDTLEIRKLEGNPLHPGSRGRNCAKGPATLTQIHDVERILYPMKRLGKRGDGQWQRVSWDEVLNDIAGRIRQALHEGRHDEIMYHVGRPGHDGYMDRVLQAWGIDGHNSHTNVCSAGARVGYALWHGMDRPSPDHAKAKFILLLSSHLETGHYFNPHAQRIIEGKQQGAKVCVIDVRLSNTASMADYWLSPYPGTEAALLLAIANLLIQEGRFDKEFVRQWTNWEEYLREEHPNQPCTFETFLVQLKALYAAYSPAYAEDECGVPAAAIEEIAAEIAKAGSALATHVWRNAAAAHLGGWQVARALQFLVVLMGAVGTPGGTSPNVWDKFVPAPFARPPVQQRWNELLWPKEYPLAHHELSFLLPHMLKEGRGKVSMYFTRVYNPVWTNPDGFSWIEMLQDEAQIGLHACLTPVWSETAWFADYVLPMGVGAERHDLQSQETHAAKWISFRQPVRRVAMERMGKTVTYTYEANPGEVWEEDEFWIELSWRTDPDGSLGIRQYFESPYRPGEKITVEEYYRWIFEHSIPGLPEKAQVEGLTPLEYMRKYAAFLVEDEVYQLHTKPLDGSELEGATVDPVSKVVSKGGTALGVEIDGIPRAGFPTPSRKLEFFSKTLKDWGWPEYALPGYILSHVYWREMNRQQGEFPLVPTFRLPTLIHTRSGNAKWLNEISHTNPIWIHPDDARLLGVHTDELVKLHTDIGYFVNRVWVTEGIRPGVVACSHHLGRWRLKEDQGGERWSTFLAELKTEEQHRWRLRQVHGIRPFKSHDPDSERVWWEETGVHQNLTFPVHPDPISGQHCWHQKVRVEKAGPEDRYGDIFVDTDKAFQIYREWLAKTRPAPGPGGLRRPLWLTRAVRPAPEAYRMQL